MYYTTPVYQFRMKCHLCDNHFEIKTDPANLDYEIVSGARRQEKRFEARDNGTVVPDEKETIKKLASDAMFKLEHGEADSSKAKDSKPRLNEIVQIQDRVKDDYVANRLLRDKMRGARRKAKEQAVRDNILLKKSSLNIPLLPESEADATAASLLKLKPAVSSEERREELREEIIEESIFSTPSTSSNQPTAGSSSSKAKAVSDLQKLVRRKKEADVASSATSKSIGVVVKTKDNATAANNEGAVNESKNNEQSKSGGSNVLNLLSCDYGSSSSSGED